MKVAGGFDLTYCSNIHAGETWDEVSRALHASLPRIRTLLHFDGPFAIGLRLSARAACDLEQPGALDAFRAFLQQGNYYVPTINGFPYGAFHGTRVKERVYLPDWRSSDRVDYTNRLARLLATLSLDCGAMEASISTVPGAFRRALSTEAEVVAVASNILAHAAYLKRLREETGVTISLALEPEPGCLMETVDDALAFFETHLLHPKGWAGEQDPALTPDDITRHVGLCFDACHMAVEFEDPADAVARTAAAGIRICKTQLSSAVRVVRDNGHRSMADVLGRFAEDTYLHQVVASGTNGLVRYDDLPEALEADGLSPIGSEWRVHFHVPIFLSAMSGFHTTQPYLARMLEVLHRTRACQCLEVETYTWDVLPPDYRTTDMCSAIARELEWVRAALAS